MLQQIIRWLLGDVTFRISGQLPWYFLSRAAKMGFGLWGMEEREDGVFAHVGRGVWPKLSELAASSGCTLEKIEESGPYGVLLRLWGRKGLIVGFVLACLLLGQMSGRIWGISVNGCEETDPQQVLAAAADCGIEVGASMAFDAHASSGAVMRRLPEVSWLSVNTRGCFVEIELREAVPAPEPLHETGLSIVRASREGQIVSCRALAGQLLTAPGDVVERGEMLVTGLLETPDGRYLFQNAEAEILARTYRSFSTEFPVETEETVPTGEVQVRRSFRLFSLSFPLTFAPLDPRPGSVTWEEEPWCVLGTKLPVGLVTETWQGEQTFTRTRTREELAQAAEQLLLEQAKAQLGEKGEVEDYELSLTIEKGICRAQLDCTCVEDIAEEVPIAMPEQTE